MVSCEVVAVVAAVVSGEVGAVVIGTAVVGTVVTAGAAWLHPISRNVTIHATVNNARIIPAYFLFITCSFNVLLNK